MHMLYMSYVRIRSLRSPKGYTSEQLIKRPWMVMGSFWIMGIIAWTPITFGFSTKDFAIDVDYSPFFLVTIFNLISWFSVLLLTLLLSIIIIKELYLRKKKRNELFYNRSASVSITNGNSSLNTNESFRSRRSRFRIRFDFQTKFYLIIFSYWIQWIIPCILTLLQPCFCVSPLISNYIYWLTYTVSIVDKYLKIF